MAHSGGAMVSYLTLVDPAYRTAEVDKLITFGEGFNLAMVLTADRTGMFERLRRDITVERPNLRWRDFWGSHDPAPAGAVKAAQLGPVDPLTGLPSGVASPENIRSRQVWNRRSLLDDHGSYFDNDEEFTLAVLREIDRPDGWGETPSGELPVSRFYPTPEPPEPVDARQPPLDARARRHRERVGILALMRQVSIATAITAITAVLADRTRLSELGKGLGELLAAIPVVHDLAAKVVPFLEGLHLGEVAVADPPFGLAPFVVQPDRIIDALGLATLQAIVLISIVQLIFAPVRADEAWASSDPRRRLFRATEWGIVVMLLGATAVLALAPPHEELLGAGWQQWLPGIGLTVATFAAGWAGTAFARAVPGFSRFYAGLTMLIFVAAIASSVLVMFRRPGLEHGELGYVVIWTAFLLLYRIGRDRWAQWDRVERQAAYESSPDVRRSRLPVQISILGFVVAGLAIVAWILPGGTVITVTLAIVSVVIVGIAIVAGWLVWPARDTPMTSLSAVDSARGKV
jgi:hypothetical protein